MRKKKALKSIIASLVLQLTTIVCGFIVPKLIIDHYGSATNGLISSITQFLAYISLLQSGFGPVVKSVLYKPLAKKDNSEIASILNVARKFFRNIGFIFIVYLVALCLIYPSFVYEDFDRVFTISLIIILSISTFGEYFVGMVYQIFLQADQKAYVSSNIQILATILNTVLTIVLIYSGQSIIIVKLVSAIVYILRPLLMKMYFDRHYKIDIRSGDKNYVLKQKWDGLAQHIAAVIHGSTDVAVITIFCGLLEVSVYSVYMLVVNKIKLLAQSFTSGIDASFGDLHAREETSKLNESFRKYELIYHTINAIVFICTMILITPFVHVYVGNVTDINYIRPVFGVLIVISEFIWGVRLPYSSLTLSAGHFKETRKGAWVEAITNIVISVLLVNSFGIIGVAIGTIVAMLIRTIEFMYHTSKHILHRNPLESFRWLFVAALESAVAYVIVNNLLTLESGGYARWIGDALIVAIMVGVLVTVVNILFNLKTFKEILYDLKKKFIFRNK